MTGRESTRCTSFPSSKGFVLVSAMLLVLLLAGILIGVIDQVHTEISLVATDLESTKAFYAAEAAMEKMMADLSGLYASRLAPTVSEIPSSWIKLRGSACIRRITRSGRKVGERYKRHASHSIIGSIRQSQPNNAPTIELGGLRCQLPGGEWRARW